MRVHIQRGSSAIEVDGDYDDIEKVLAKWWGDATNFAELPTEESAPKPTKKSSKKQVRKTTSSDSKPSNGFDATATVNEIRNDPRFEVFKKKIIIGDTNRANRAKFVSWFTHAKPLTSGNIQKVLQGLGVKIDPATVSRALADAKNDYMRDDSGAQPLSYLTERARAEYEAWLMNEDA